MRKDFFAIRLNNTSLLKRLKQLMMNERKVQSLFISHLAEVDRRRLYAVEGFSSLCSYCVQVLGLSESSALKRIQVARLSRKFPQVSWLLEEGKISLTALSRVAPHIKDSNVDFILKEAIGRSIRELDNFLAGLFPRPEPFDRIKPLSEERVHFSFVAGREFEKDLERGKELLRHKYPEGKLKDVLGDALRSLLNSKDRNQKKKLEGKRPVTQRQESSRYIPELLKQQVWERDEGKCAYVSPQGRRCATKAWLEWDHIKAWGLGGTSHDPGNVRLLCRTHNRLSADQSFGSAFMETTIRSKQHSPGNATSQCCRVARSIGRLPTLEV